MSIKTKILCALASAFIAFSSASGIASVAFNQSAEAVNISIEGIDGKSAYEMFNCINEFRATSGNDDSGAGAWFWNEDNRTKTRYNVSGSKTLNPLVYDYTLEKVAIIRAHEIVKKFDHTRPNGGNMKTALDEVDSHYAWYALGENLAAGISTAEGSFVQLREDKDNYAGQGHRRNMLNPEFSAVGIAHVYVPNSTYKHYWVQIFAGSNSPNLDEKTAIVSHNSEITQPKTSTNNNQSQNTNTNQNTNQNQNYDEDEDYFYIENDTLIFYINHKLYHFSIFDYPTEDDLNLLIDKLLEENYGISYYDTMPIENDNNSQNNTNNTNNNSNNNTNSQNNYAPISVDVPDSSNKNSNLNASITIDTANYIMKKGDIYDIGITVKDNGRTLSGAEVKALVAKGVIKVSDSRTGSIVDLTQLSNGNFRVKGKNNGTCYIVYSIMDGAKEVNHASVKIDVKDNVKQGGTSVRNTSLFDSRLLK